MAARIFLLLFVLLGSVQPLLAQRVKQKKVPLELLMGFRDKYPAAEEPEFRKTKAGWLVKYKHLGAPQESTYDKSLNWVATRTVITEASLTYTTVRILQERFPNCKIREVMRYELPGGIETQLKVDCEKQSTALVFDVEGRLLREELTKVQPNK